MEAAETDPTGTLPWREEYAELFGSREDLINVLRTRWQHTCEAQLDSSMSELELKEAHRKLLNTHAAVLRILDNHRFVPDAGAEGISVA